MAAGHKRDANGSVINREDALSDEGKKTTNSQDDLSATSMVVTNHIPVLSISRDISLITIPRTSINAIILDV